MGDERTGGQGRVPCVRTLWTLLVCVLLVVSGAGAGTALSAATADGGADARTATGAPAPAATGAPGGDGVGVGAVLAGAMRAVAPSSGNATAAGNRSDPTATGAAGATVQADGDGGDGDWPMYGRDTARTGAAPGVGLISDPTAEWNRTAGEVTASAAVGDVNGDGSTEVVVGTLGGQVVALNGTTGETVWRAELASYEASSPAIGDIDGDGTPEVVVAGGSGDPLYALGGENGSVEWSTRGPGEGWDVRSTDPVLADVDADGTTEVVVRGFKPFGFAPLRLLAFDGRTGETEWTGPPRDRDSFTAAATPAVANLDGDPELEVVVGFGREPRGAQVRAVRALDGANGTTDWTHNVTVGEGVGFQGGLSLGDVDGDGGREVVAVAAGARRAVALDGATGDLVWNQSLPLRVEQFEPSAPSLGDLDGDGGQEVAIGGQNEVVALDGATGDPLWVAGRPELGEVGTPGDPRGRPALADIDGDWRTEVVLADPLGDRVLTLDGATGRREWSVRAPNVIGDDTFADITAPVAVADADDDGRLEVVFTSSDGVVSLGSNRTAAPAGGALRVDDYTPTVARAPGALTFTAAGSGLGNATVVLESPGGQRVEPAGVRATPGLLTARFAPADRTVGVWNATIVRGEERRRLPVFVPPAGPLVDLRDSWPDQTVPGRTTEVGLLLRNRGLDDGVAVVAVQFPDYVTVEGVAAGRNGTVLVNESHRVVLAQPVTGDGGSASAAVQYRLRPDAVAFPSTEGDRPVELDRRTSLGTAIHLGTLTRAQWRSVRDESPLDVQIRAANATNQRLVRVGQQLNETDSGRDLVRVLNASHDEPAGQYVGLLLTRTSETMWSLYAGWNRSRAGVGSSKARAAFWPARGAVAPRRSPRYGRGLPPTALRARVQSDRNCWQELGKGAFNAAATYTGAPVSFTDEGVSATLPTPVVPVSAEVTGPGSEGGVGVDLSGPSVSDAPGMVQDGARRISRRAARRAGDYAQNARGLNSQYFRQRTAQAANRGAKAAKVARKAGKVARFVAAFNAGWEIGEGIRKYINCRLKEEGLDTTYSELMGKGIYDAYPDAVGALADATTYAERKWRRFERWWWDTVGGGEEGGDGGSEVVASIDPNDIQVRPEGVGAGDYVASDRRLTYRVRFENLANASAAARDVTVTVPVDRSLDYDSIETVASSHPDVLAVSRNPDARTVTWTFSGIDLPPNENPPEGEGYVEFTARPSPNVTLARATNATGAANGSVDRTIVANATIQFEANPPIETNVLTQRVDARAPETRVASLDRVQPRNFTVAWNGSDAGAGLAGGRLLVARAGNDSYRTVGVLNISQGANASLRTNTTANATNATASATVTRNGTLRVSGEPGVTYRLATVGVDRLGNVESAPAAAEAAAVVTINTAPEAAFEASTAEPATGETVTFTDRSSDEVGNVSERRWRFGDGETATGERVEHAYAEPGTYTVELVVTDEQGASDTVTREVVVAAQSTTAGGNATDGGGGGGGGPLDGLGGPLAVGGAVALIALAAGAYYLRAG